MCGPIFLSASSTEYTILSETGSGFKIGQSGDFIVDRDELRLGRVKRAGAAPGVELIERPNASFRVDEQASRWHLFSAESPGD